MSLNRSTIWRGRMFQSGVYKSWSSLALVLELIKCCCNQTTGLWMLKMTIYDFNCVSHGILWLYSSIMQHVCVCMVGINLLIILLAYIVLNISLD